jgi:hypothetical protein
MLTFEKCCDEISAAKSRNDKREILDRYKDDQEVRELFSLCFSSTVNFGVLLPESENLYTTTSYTGVMSILNGLRKKQCDSTNSFLVERHFGKWIIKLINRNLNLGIAAGTIEKVWPGIIGHTKIMEAEEIHFGQGENFCQLMQHLEDSKNWSIYGAKSGIPCLCSIAGGEIFFVTTSPVNIINTEYVEADLEHLFGHGSQCVLQGKLLLNGERSINDTYEVFTSKAAKDRVGETFFQIQDVLSDSFPYPISRDEAIHIFKNRIGFIKDIFEKKEIDTPYQHIGLPYIQRTDYSSDHQLKELRDQGYSKAYICYDKGLYKTGKSRDFLSLKL